MPQPNVEPTVPDEGIAVMNPTTADRLLSLDALRGFNMFWIIGGAEVFDTLGKKSGSPIIRQVTDNLSQHVNWEGIHWHDMIFPLFLFIIGVLLPYSLGRRLEQGVPRKQLLWKVLKRTVILFFLGWIYYGFLEFKGLDHQRLFGVLQRLALGYGFAALIFLYTGIRGQAIACGFWLVIYWLMMKYIPVPGYGAANYTEWGNLANYIDRTLFLRTQNYLDYGDPEGLFSTIPAIGTALLGVLAGHWLRSGRPKAEIARGLFAAGIVSIAAGYAWGFDFPVIKKIWTSSYVLVAGGWSLLLLGAFYWTIEVKGWTRWTFFWVVIGLNPITIYLADRIVDFEGIAKFFVGGAAKFFHGNQTLVLLLAVLAAHWLFLLFLHRQRIYLKV